MKQPFASCSSPTLRIERPEAVRAFTDPRTRRFLEPFIGQERRIGEVARLLGASPSSVLYRVRQFERLGLVGVVRLEPRAGRALCVYRAVADSFYIPFSATPYETAEALSPETFQPLQAVLNRSVGRAWLEAAGTPQALGVHISCDGLGNLSRNIVPDPEAAAPTRFFDALLTDDAPAVWDTWGVRRLSPEDAKALQRELAGVFQRYAPQDGTAARHYIVRLALAPLADEG